MFFHNIACLQKTQCGFELERSHGKAGSFNYCQLRNSAIVADDCTDFALPLEFIFDKLTQLMMPIKKP